MLIVRSLVPSYDPAGRGAVLCKTQQSDKWNAKIVGLPNTHSGARRLDIWVLLNMNDCRPSTLASLHTHCDGHISQTDWAGVQTRPRSPADLHTPRWPCLDCNQLTARAPPPATTNLLHQQVESGTTSHSQISDNYKIPDNPIGPTLVIQCRHKAWETATLYCVLCKYLVLPLTKLTGEKQTFTFQVITSFIQLVVGGRIQFVYINHVS